MSNVSFVDTNSSGSSSIEQLAEYSKQRFSGSKRNIPLVFIDVKDNGFVTQLSNNL